MKKKVAEMKKKRVISCSNCYGSRMILIHIEDGGTTASQEWGPDGARPGTTASQEKGPGWSSPWNHGISREGARVELTLEPHGNCLVMQYFLDG